LTEKDTSRMYQLLFNKRKVKKAGLSCRGETTVDTPAAATDLGGKKKRKRSGNQFTNSNKHQEEIKSFADSVAAAAAAPAPPLQNLSSSPFQSLRGKRFDIILADPPWQYEVTGLSGCAEKHYRTMNIDDIKMLPVHELSEPGCYLLMWATGPMLPKAASVIAAWGFDYKTVFMVWVKTMKSKPSEPIYNAIGSYTQSACEYLLIARRCKSKLPLKDVRASRQVKQLVMAQRREHSRKPDETFARIDEFFIPGLKKIELFARETRPGWESWGNQTNLFNDTRDEEEKEEDPSLDPSFYC